MSEYTKEEAVNTIIYKMLCIAEDESEGRLFVRLLSLAFDLCEEDVEKVYHNDDPNFPF